MTIGKGIAIAGIWIGTAIAAVYLHNPVVFAFAVLATVVL